MRLLVVEDVDTKFDDVIAALKDIMPQADITRASNLNSAEDEIMSGAWDLVVLDLSMDIAAEPSSNQSSGHATLGGLDVLERMALLKIRFPTILLTGFDSFQDPDRFDNSIMNLADVNELAEKWLGESYLGCVRYGSEKWTQRLVRALEKFS